ncbi:hypothetical protein HMPREF9714_02340 [Myroides odoratimimus CCUG 12901]|uniref:hypothetical protein n=1 Tax=Myroides odoratimimus TaxID=76832 RepID=UPI000245F5C4|nr:hypothetical protein [Myroides odoratimimus]EHO08317.1 hypothetical protein HMPREF9714_02340 [Myroides odoratimimus CCUG 12901]EPH13603.1 hypothetical protein HMPREF9713_00550 [Myroides odoratimimus CCUG 12700]MDM1060404.1 hypothetical protein [Myroides odoratimimus]MDM1066284.1 hypothetical protein [Myroides odoratimimus]MDM1499292.1 hypothetical protein [Myroides odoratimimus]
MTKNNNTQLDKMTRPLLIDKVNRGEKGVILQLYFCQIEAQKSVKHTYSFNPKQDHQKYKTSKVNKN